MVPEVITIYNNSKRFVKREMVNQDVVVWQCSECPSWSRKEFVSDSEPKCPICGSGMAETTRSIPMAVGQS